AGPRGASPGRSRPDAVACPCPRPHRTEQTVARSDQSAPPIPHSELREDGEHVEPIDERWLSLIDAALKAQAPLARSYVERLREAHPEATDRQLLQHVTSRFVALTTLTGAGIGGGAALPGLGTAAARGLTVGEGVGFAGACAFLTRSARRRPAPPPAAPARRLLQPLPSRFVALTPLTGAGIGGVAALPGLGTAAALGLTVGEGVSFAEACAFLTLSAAEIHGVDMAE